MKRKLTVLAAMLCIAALMCGCVMPGEDIPAAEEPAIDEPAIEEPATEEPAAEEPVLEEPAGCSVSIEPVIDEGSLHVFTPVISGLADTARQEELNAAFFNDTQLVMQDLPGNSELDWLWTTVYESDTMISLLNTNYYYSPESAHPWNGCSTFNFDPATGKCIHLYELCDTQAMAALLFAGEFTAMAPDGTDVTADVTIESIMDMNAMVLGTWDYSYTEETVKAMLDVFDSDPSENPLGYSYMQNGAMHLVFTYIHAVGDYIVVTPSDPCLKG